ncbi:MAG: hydrogen peroxide-inducible genes activator [Pseudomonadota bacterium]
MDKPAITLKQLLCFLAVDETQHFRRAAERQGISQPSLSAQIQNLEQVLRVQLVERSRSGVAITPIGREVANRARRVVEDAQSIVDLAAASRGGLMGTIRLGTSPTLGPYLLPHVVSTLHKRHQELSLYVRESPPRDLEYDLGKGVHDVIITQLPAVSTEHVAVHLFREPLYLAVAVDHPLAAHDALTVNALKGLDILSLGPQYHLYEQVNSICQSVDARLVRDYEGTSLDALRQMVGMGMGASFLPALYVHSEIRARSEIVIKEIKGRTITRSIGLVWRKSAGRAENYKTIAELIREVAVKRFKDLKF